MIKKVKLVDIEKRAKAFFPRQRHQQGAETLLVVDGMNIAYQAYYAYKMLSYMGKKTSILFGVLTILKTILSRYRPHKVIVCWDGARHPERIKLVPGYKSHRKERPKDFNRQLKGLRKLLLRLGVAQAYNTEMEGDDMIYWVWKKYSPLYRIIIVTADKDMHQLINYDTTIYDPRSQVPFSSFAYICDHMVEPHQFIDYLCLVGDKSDDIPGYNGIGPSKAAGFLKAFPGGVREYLKSKKELTGLMDKEKLKKIWRRNRMMIDLEKFNQTHHKPEDLTFYKGKRNPEYDRERFNALCLRYGMKSLVSEMFQEQFKRLADL